VPITRPLKLVLIVVPAVEPSVSNLQHYNHLTNARDSSQCGERAKIEVQISGIDAMAFSQFMDGRFQSHQRRAKPLDLAGIECTSNAPSYRM
jgi:hypothetical protein